MTERTDQPNTTPTQAADDELLPCGRLLSRTWDEWERGVDDPHLHSCPYCGQAVRGLDDLESVVRGLQEETDTTASAYDSEPLTRRIMDVVRLELRPGRPLPLGEPAEDLWIMEAVAARALRGRPSRCRVSGPVPAGSATARTPARSRSASTSTPRPTRRCPTSPPRCANACGRRRTVNWAWASRQSTSA